MKETSKKYGILAWPAYTTKSSNPYNYLIYKNIEQNGHKIIDFDFNIKNVLKYAISNDFSIFHIHWPTNILTYSTYLQAKRRVFVFKCFLLLIKLLGKKIVWTVHNLNGHEKDHPKLQKELNDLLYKYVDGFISLNKNGLELIKKKANQINRQHFAFIPHPHYIGYYPNVINKEESRKKLNIQKDKFIFLFLGQIRKYKNLPRLIYAFNQLNLENKHLLIAGKIHEELQDQIADLGKDKSDISLFNEFINDTDLQIYLNACDLVVTPYQEVFNSGSVFLNLSFNKPTLCPDRAVFRELREEVGEDLILLYDGDISADSLAKATETIIKANNIVHFQSDNFSPEHIADRTIDFYNILLND